MTDDERLLKDLGRLEREKRADDQAQVPAFAEELCEGTLPEDEEERLRKQAEDSRETQKALEIFQPLESDFQARMVRELRAEVGSRRLFRFPQAIRRTGWRFLAAAATLAAAVVGLWWWIGPTAPDEIAVMPAFRLRVLGITDQRSSGEDPGIPVWAAASNFVITLKPETELFEPVDVRFFVVREGDWREWKVEAQIAETGAVRVEERLEGELLLEPGTWTLVAAVGRPRALPSLAKIRQRFERGERTADDASWRWISTPVEVVALPLEVEFGGCAAVLDSKPHPTCILSQQETLDLWVRSALGSAVEIRAGKRSLDPSEGDAIDGGFRFHLTGLEAGELEVRASRGGSESSWRLILKAPQFEDLDEAKRFLSKDGPASARRYLEERFDPEAPALVAGVLQSFLSRLADDFEQARTEAERALELHRQAGNVAGQIDDLTFLHYLHFYQLDNYEAARQVLFEKLPDLVPGDSDSAYLAAFYRGQWAYQVGDARTAVDQLDTAGRLALRLHRPRQRNLVDQRRAHQLRRLGQHRDAMALFARLVDEVDVLPTACEKAKLLNNAAWDRLLALEARLPAENPLAELEEAAKLVNRCPPQDDEERVNLRLNLALARLQDDDFEGARQELERARQEEQTPRRRMLVWQYDLEARIAFAEGRPSDAIELYDALEKVATAGEWPGVGWRAAVGRARILESLGDLDSALAQLARAEALLDRESAQAPIDTGRETSVSAREWGTPFFLDLLLREGREAEALMVARRGRSRFFRGLARNARSWDLSTTDAGWSQLVTRYNLLRSDFETTLAGDWKLPTRQQQAAEPQRQATRQELGRLLDQALSLLHGGDAPSDVQPPPVKAGDLLLLYHPAPDGWFGFAATANDLVVRRLDAIELSGASRSELSRHFLEPFVDAIASAQRVYMLPYGALRTVDFHALPFAGDVLLAAKPVVYGLDLPPAALARSERRALLVEDPTGSLAAAGVEIAVVERALSRLEGWNVDRFEGDAEDLRDLLPSVDLLHFAGHVDTMGRTLESGLAFDRDAGIRLTVGDLLIRERAPTVVVLSACEAARASADGAPVGLGVAHAFLLAGSRTVLGATRQVDDQLTAELVRHLYEVWDGSPEGTAPALAAAQLELRRQRPDADWASFRVLER